LDLHRETPRALKRPEAARAEPILAVLLPAREVAHPARFCWQWMEDTVKLEPDAAVWGVRAASFDAARSSAMYFAVYGGYAEYTYVFVFDAPMQRRFWRVPSQRPPRPFLAGRGGRTARSRHNLMGAPQPRACTAAAARVVGDRGRWKCVPPSWGAP
jgi:hypothetical protein